LINHQNCSSLYFIAVDPIKVGYECMEKYKFNSTAHMQYKLCNDHKLMHELNFG
jgi:hypothetical protein